MYPYSGLSAAAMVYDVIISKFTQAADGLEEAGQPLALDSHCRFANYSEP